eukprot:Nk52_evm32s343 gene=Nk52_evmTU32s343
MTRYLEDGVNVEMGPRFPQRDGEGIYDDPIDIFDFLLERTNDNPKIESEVSSLRSSVYRLKQHMPTAEEEQVVLPEIINGYDICGICFDSIYTTVRASSELTSSSNRALDGRSLDSKDVPSMNTFDSSVPYENISLASVNVSLSTFNVAISWPSKDCSCTFCCKCLSKYIEGKIFAGEATRIKCPDCTRQLSESDVRSFIVNPSTQRLYDKLLKDSLIVSNPNAIFCPVADCDGCAYCPPELNAGESMPTKKIKVVCDKCACELCFRCQGQWHEKGSCEKAQKKRLKKEQENGKSEWRFSMWARKKTRKCPQCRTVIEKLQDGSCNHMTCGVCKTEFCWLCGKSIPPEGHFDADNLSGCPGMQYADKMTKEGRLRKKKKAAAHYSKVVGMCIVGIPFFVVAAVPVGIYFGVKTVVNEAKSVSRRRRESSEYPQIHTTLEPVQRVDQVTSDEEARGQQNREASQIFSEFYL